MLACAAEVGAVLEGADSDFPVLADFLGLPGFQAAVAFLFRSAMSVSALGKGWTDHGLDHGFGTGNCNDTSCGESKHDDNGLGKHSEVDLRIEMKSRRLLLKRTCLVERSIAVVVACCVEMRMEEHKTNMREHLGRPIYRKFFFSDRKSW